MSLFELILRILILERIPVKDPNGSSQMKSDSHLFLISRAESHLHGSTQ